MKVAALVFMSLAILADNQAIIDLESLPPVKPKKEEPKTGPKAPKDPIIKAYVYIS